MSLRHSFNSERGKFRNTGKSKIASYQDDANGVFFAYHALGRACYTQGMDPDHMCTL